MTFLSVLFVFSVRASMPLKNERNESPLFLQPFPVDEAQADAAFTAAPNGSHNVTAKYREYFAQPDGALTPERLAAFSGCRAILVHGLLGEVGLKVQGVLNAFDDSGQRMIGFFKDQEAALNKMGLKHQRVVYRSDRVDRCAGKIVDAVLHSDEPVVIFSHSKGCIDTLEALLRLQRAGKLDKVRGWVSVQGVFYGAPSADRYVENGARRTFGIVVMRCLGGDFDAIRDCSQKAREEYMDAHADEISQLVDALPVVCFASWALPDSKDEKQQKKDKNKNEKNAKADDGAPRLVSAYKIQPESSLLPGADFVAKSGVSHNQTVISNEKPFDRVRFTQTLFAMLADRTKK
jgi:hypothetical protein